LLLYCKP